MSPSSQECAAFAGSQLLHNMSGRPRTLVEWDIQPLNWSGLGSCSSPAIDVDPPLRIRFELQPLRPALKRRLGCNRWSWHHLSRLSTELEQAWEAYAFRGAILLSPWRDHISERPAGRRVESAAHGIALRATDPILVLNVLGRVRGGLLLPRFSLELEEAFLSRRLCADDPRLLSLARCSGVEEIES